MILVSGLHSIDFHLLLLALRFNGQALSMPISANDLIFVWVVVKPHRKVAHIVIIIQTIKLSLNRIQKLLLFVLVGEMDV